MYLLFVKLILMFKHAHIFVLCALFFTVNSFIKTITLLYTLSITVRLFYANCITRVILIIGVR